MNSDMTKYGLIGRSCERRLASQRPSHSPFSLSICLRAPLDLAFLPMRSFTASINCASTSFASPRIGIAVSLALWRSRASFVAWMIVLPGDDDRRFRLDQHLGGIVDVARVSGRAGAPYRRVVDLVAGEFGGHHISRHLDHDRSGTAVLQRVERAAHRRQCVLRQQYRL